MPERATLLAVLLAVSVVFVWSLWAFVGAILWSLVAAIMFAGVNRRLLGRLPDRPGAAAGLTLLLIAGAIILPAVLIGGLLLDQASGLYARFQSGQIDLPALFEQLRAVLPEWLRHVLERFGITDFGSVSGKLSAGFSSQLRSVLERAVDVGQNAASFMLSLAIMLYLTFYLLRYGEALSGRIGQVVPLPASDRGILARRFVTVVRATVKGGVVVGAAQGAVGGVVMGVLGVPNALLWAVVMAFSSLLPAVGTGLVWVPAALYLLAVGHVWQGIAMAVAGIAVIGSVDNVLRPILIGRETKIPDALVLVTTLGGLDAFGFNGLLIGPVAAALFITVWDRFATQRRGVSTSRAPERRRGDTPNSGGSRKPDEM